MTESTEDGCRVYLDRTAFYPSSGGQPNDLGTLGGRAVLDVIDEEERIAHVLASPLAESAVEGCIDWPRRYDHMQQHTGQHLLSAAFVELFGLPTLSFHMGGEVSSIELGSKELTEAQIDSVEERVSQIVGEARRVNIQFEAADAARDLRKPSGRSGTLRIIEIEGFDRSACGGTHVRSTAELGPIQIRKTEKIRGHVRVEFVCGTRALRRAKQDFRILSELGREGAAAFERLPEQFASLRQRLAEAEKERHRLMLEMARREGEALYPGDYAFGRWNAARKVRSQRDRRCRARQSAGVRQPLQSDCVGGCRGWRRFDRSVFGFGHSCGGGVETGAGGKRRAGWRIGDAGARKFAGCGGVSYGAGLFVRQRCRFRTGSRCRRIAARRG